MLYDNRLNGNFVILCNLKCEFLRFRSSSFIFWFSSSWYSLVMMRRGGAIFFINSTLFSFASSPSPLPFLVFFSYSSSAFIDAIVLNACSSVALKTVDSCFDWWSVIDHHIFPDSQRFSKWFFSEYKLTELWSHCKLFCSRYCAWSHIRCTRNRTWVKWKIDVLVFCSSFVRFASGRVCVCEYV